MERFSQKFIAPLMVALTLLVVAPGLAMAESKIYSKSGKAISGADPVAYFAEGKYVEGKGDFTHEWKGAKWYFSSAANRDAFASSPDKYAPQYGGYCAWAVSKGATAKTEPDSWKIVNGKLYLNYNKDIQERWESAGPEKLIPVSDKNWETISKDLTE